jgi:hypothetical protein
MKLSLRIKSALFFLFFASTVSLGQVAKTVVEVQHTNQEKCGTSHKNELMLKSDPNFALKRQEAEIQYQGFLNAPFIQKAVKTIPIVVHIIHKGEAVGTGTNISDAQVISAINNLNDAFRNRAPYSSSSYPSVDTEIEFCLAQRDPSGNPSTGILRVNGTSLTGYSAGGIGDGGATETSVKALSKWDNTKYYNIWVVSEIDNNGGGSGTQGYAYYPGAGPTVDGTVILFNAFGYDPTGSLGYNLKSYTNRNATTTHEIGHALNLYHTFEGDSGGGSCPTQADGCGTGNGDCVSDTPRHRRSNSDCQTETTNPCTNTSRDLHIHNWMDYSSDVCQTQFTNGQSTRMNATLAPGGLRHSLTNSDGCNPVFANDISITNIIAPNGSYCLTTFSPQVTLKNVGTSNLTSAVITYNIDADANQTYNWSGNLASGTSEIVTLNSMSTSAGVHTFSATSTLPNGLADQFEANNTSSANFNITSSEALPFNEDFEGTFPPNGWTNVSTDVYANASWDSDPSIRQWEQRPVIQQSSGIAGNAAAFNGFAYGVNLGTTDELISPTINFASVSSPQLKFQVSYKYYGASNFEKLRVLISTDCGVTYTPVYDKEYTELALALSGQTTSSWAPTLANHWREETIDLSAYAGQIATFKFEATNGYGNNLYIDKINITDNCNPPVISSNPSNITICSNNSTSFAVTNLGSGTYQWQVDSGSGFNNISNGGIYSNATTSTLNLSGVGVSENGNSYRCVITSSCGNVTSNSASLTVNATPPMPTISVSGATTFCQGESVILTSSNTEGNLWSTGEITKTITVNSTGNYTVQTTLNGCNSGLSDQTAVTVNPIPSISLGTLTNPSACLATDGSIQINGSGTGNLSWTGTSSSSMNAVSLPATVFNLAAGSYNFTFDDGCVSNGISGSLNDPGAPATPTISSSGSTTLCEGQSVTLTSSSASGNLWSNGETSPSIIVNTAASYTVQVTVSGCTSSSSLATTVTVNSVPPTPTISASGATTFCQGESVILTSSNTEGNLWSTGEITKTITVNSTGNYTVQTTLNGCNSGLSDQTAVTVNPIPSISLGTLTNPSACLATDGSIQINGSGTGNLSWTGTSSSSMNAVSLPATVFNLAAGSYKFTFDDGCVSNGILTSLSDPGVIIPTISSNNGNTICEGENIILTSSSSTGNTWSTGETSESISANIGGNFSVTVLDAGCSATSLNFTLTVNPTPATPTISANGLTDFCSGNSVTLTSSAMNGNTWSTGETSKSITVSSTGNYFVNVIENTCVSEQSNSININVTQTPATPTITADGSTTICFDESINLTSDATSNNTWSNGLTSQTINVTESGTYSVTVNNGACTATSNEITVTVNNGVTIPTITASSSLTFCEGGSVNLTSSEPSGNTWSNGLSTNSITVTESGIYTVSLGSGACLGTSEPVLVTVNLNPVVSLEQFETICNNIETFTLNQGTPTNGTYTVNGSTASEFNPASAIIGTNTIIYTVIDANLCSSSATETIQVNDCSSLNEVLNSKLKIYPNPTNSIVKIESVVDFNKIEVRDEVGRLIFNSNRVCNEILIDFNNYASGIYTLFISGKDFEEIQKINFIK